GFVGYDDQRIAVHRLLPFGPCRPEARLEPQPEAAELDLVAREQPAARRPAAVHARAVRAPEVLEDVALAVPRDRRVLAGGPRLGGPGGPGPRAPPHAPAAVPRA